MSETSIDGYYTLAQAAEKIGVHVSQVSRYVAAKQLPAIDLGRQKLIPREAVDTFERPKVGNPSWRK